MEDCNIIYIFVYKIILGSIAPHIDSETDNFLFQTICQIKCIFNTYTVDNKQQEYAILVIKFCHKILNIR